MWYEQMNKERFPLLLSVALIFMITYVLNASASTIKGNIIDTSGRQAANVTVLISDQYQYTDSNGRFRIKNISPGSHTLKVMKNRETIKTIEIDINDSIKRIEIQL